MSGKPNHGETNPSKDGSSKNKPSENDLANTDTPEAQNAGAEGNTYPAAEPALDTPKAAKQEASTVSSSPSETDETSGEGLIQEQDAALESISKATSDEAEATSSEAEPASSDTETQRTKTKQPVEPSRPKRQRAVWVVLILMVLGWGTTAGAGYWYYQQQLSVQQGQHANQQNLKRAAQQVVADTQQQLQQLDTSVSDFKQSVNGKLNNIEREANADLRKLSSQLKEHEARLNGQQQRLTSLSTTSKEDWLLAEAEYLLKLANQRVLLERTPNNVVALLTRADSIIEQVSAGLGDRELFAIRKLLAQEVTALKMVEPVDTQGLYLKIGALAEAIHTLPTLPTQQERFAKTKGDDKEDSESLAPEGFVAEFKREMANVFDFVRTSFSIKSENELTNPIVTQQRLQLMQLNTRLLLEQAQIALLKENTVSFQESLKAAAKLTAQYYFESPQRDAFADEIITLAEYDIAPELPDISQSLKMLHTYVAAQHRINAPVAGAGE